MGMCSRARDAPVAGGASIVTAAAVAAAVAAGRIWSPPHVAKRLPQGARPTAANRIICCAERSATATACVRRGE